MTGTSTPVLEPERIDRMRSEVMTQIAAHERSAARRGRRRSRLVLAAAAASVVVIAGVVMGDLLSVSAGDSGSYDVGGPEIGIARDSDGGAQAGADSMAGDVESADLADSASVITTGWIAVRVGDVDATVDALRDFAASHGGRIDAESVSGGDVPGADLTIRVPAVQVPALRRALDDVGEVLSADISRLDVATQVADVDARIESLETSIRRLRSIIDDAASTRDLLEAEAQLTQRQSELESLQAQQRALADQTSLARIDISISSFEGPRSVAPGGFVGGLTRGWNALVATVNAAVAVAGFLAPWLLPLGAVAGLALLGRRLLRR